MHVVCTEKKTLVSYRFTHHPYPFIHSFYHRCLVVFACACPPTLLLVGHELVLMCCVTSCGVFRKDGKDMGRGGGAKMTLVETGRLM